MAVTATSSRRTVELPSVEEPVSPNISKTIAPRAPAPPAISTNYGKRMASITAETDIEAPLATVWAGVDRAIIEMRAVLES
ncbi:hypothetical protein Ahu01nite_053590 [Winogradskya humida]|uniref:Uncharacterized protein n=1 Tax=Winogradskya humida TaxID=113566 RepID=A0ABQ3ZUQ1_9ACTN|nr:hypothetical protein Ahu01nite_053590 [Actinoplanes humidus]